MKPFALEVEHLNVHYGSHVALKEVSLQIPRGVLVGIVGPNGAGKSTLVKTICGMEKPRSGSIRFFDETLSSFGKKIAYVPQKNTVEWDFPITVLEVVLMGAYPRLGLFRRPKASDKKKAFQILCDLGIENLADEPIGALSGGQQQRVFIARALMQEAELFFLDEPFTGIDAVSEKTIMHILQELKKQNKTLFVIHHDIQTWKRYFDWLILLKKEVISYGPIEQVMTKEHLREAYGLSALTENLLNL